MKQVSIPIKPDNKLNIKASEDLILEGKDTQILVAVVRQSDSFKYTELTGNSEIKATSDCHLQIPSMMTVTVEKVGSDASVTGLLGRVIIGKVGGDLLLHNLAGASIESVGGDLNISNSGDGMEVSRVGGDLYGKQIQALSTRAVGGDARLLQVTGHVNLSAGGDVDLEFINSTLPAAVIIAGGDVRIVVPKDAQGQLELKSEGNTIQIHASGQEGDWEDELLSLPLGEGGNQLKISAGGDILITEDGSMAADFNETFTSNETDWNSFGEDLEKQIRESFGDSMENIKWATSSATLAADKAQLKLEKALHKMESNGVVIDHNGINVDRNGKHVGITFGTPANGQQKTVNRLTDEERLLILKMLQEKKITAEEADQLLTALEK